GPQSPLLNLPASGSTPTTAVPTSLTELSAIVPSQTSPSVTSGTLSSGSPIPPFDPALIGSLTAQHSSTPETDTLSTGTPVLDANATAGNLGVTQGFSTGTSIN